LWNWSVLRGVGTGMALRPPLRASVTGQEGETQVPGTPVIDRYG
jgi:hypothetical protein